MFSAFRIWRIGQTAIKNPALPLSRNTFLLLVILGLVQWSNFAFSASSFARVPPAHDQSIRPTPELTPIPTWQTLDEPQVAADFDGDNKWDVAKAHRVGDQYEIILLLSSQLDPVTLSPSVRSGAFRLLARDVNEDGFEDIVVANPGAPHPQAAWLGDGKGGFSAADAERFDNHSDITGFPAYSRCTVPIQPDIWSESRSLVCEISTLAFVEPEATRNGFIRCRSTFPLIQNRHSTLTLRSPPLSLQF